MMLNYELFVKLKRGVKEIEFQGAVKSQQLKQ